MAEIVLNQVSKTFDKETVIPSLNLHIRDGSFTVLVGPSGCGKSTTLRMIAGLEKITDGELLIDGKRMNHVPPGKRDVAMVFQNYALYPTMTVRENIEFGLINRKVPKQERKDLIDDICEIVGLHPYLKRKPSSLSGGQRQRVALARAMVKKPKVFLMDEPLSNLDARLRNQMRMELIQLHKRLQTTFLFVTHDQVEAMSLGDEIVIMDQGKIRQAATPMEIYQNPSNLFSARFIGTPPMNVLPMEHKEIRHIGFRPEKTLMQTKRNDSCVRVIPEKAFHLSGTIIARETLGSETIYKVETANGDVLVKSYEEPEEEGQDIDLWIDRHNLYYFDVGGDRIRNDLFQADGTVPQFIGGVI